MMGLAYPNYAIFLQLCPWTAEYVYVPDKSMSLSYDDWPFQSSSLVIVDVISILVQQVAAKGTPVG